MQKILVGVIFLIGVFAPFMLSLLGFDVNFNDAGCGGALILTVLAGVFISLGIDEWLNKKFDCWH